MVPCRKNFALYTLCRRDVGSWYRHQNCFPSGAVLKFLRSLKPILPLLFYLHIILQFTQCIFLLSELLPHQNFRIMASISWQSLFGSLKQLIAKAGIACVTALIRISFPAWESSFSFHPFSLLHTLSFIWEKLIILFCPTKEGSPKYFSYCFMTGTPSISLISTCVASGVPLLKKIVVFSNMWKKNVCGSLRGYI